MLSVEETGRWSEGVDGGKYVGGVVVVGGWVEKVFGFSKLLCKTCCGGEIMGRWSDCGW